MSVVDYIDILIEKEKRKLKEGWTRRVEAFKEIREHLKILSKIKDDPNFQQRCEGSVIRFWNILKKQFDD
jgi:hypothetical protein